MIETVRGPIPPEDLGPTLMHEHIFVLDREIEANYPGRWDQEERLTDAVAKLRAAAASGIRTIVDLTVLGLGRDVPLVQRVAAQVDLNIVVATGLYAYDDVPMFFKFRGPGLLIDGPELLTEFFVQDLTKGIADTGVKAAIIKCATDKAGVTPGVDRILRASARAHVETGAPITTHTDAGTRRGLDQLAIFREEGVDLSRVVIGHCGDTTDTDYLTELMDAGCTIGMDRFGMDILLPFDDRVDTVARLCARGYAERMVLSHDASCFTHNFDPAVKQRVMPHWVYTHLQQDVVPALHAAGVSPAQIEQMLVHNPSRLLNR
ncbi:phosphotriesterase-related protein [Pseudonocardia kujensis]|uniref:phosphotriesterase family protein n=1 Tax=Pseudonocardia kujensis TaxID=1128675 RepID=UPI001E548B03|nr:phosphotriesterase-related protein [Pseudonocardia kujensis]MCE0765576.1 phosphotriesterase-related protein [Pseudonocardia kujensis]